MNELLQRLKQRKLGQWALAYIAAAFALVQVIDVVAQRFNWPDSIERLLILAICVGFFVLLLLAWYHGERGVQKVSGTELLLLALLLAIGGGLIWQFGGLSKTATQATSSMPATVSELPSQSASPVAVAAKSIAVLPFENLSEDKGNQYFADGMQDLILTKLAVIGDLKVISRTSTEKYASHPDNLKSIAQQLGVATILEGSVQKSGNQVLINVQLIDANNDNHLWAEAYPRTLDNIFGVEGEVAQKVADALKAKLSPADTARVAAIPTQNPEAWDLYLRALAYTNRVQDQYSLTNSTMPPAIELLQQALAKDANFALADALLGRANLYVYFLGNDRTDARLAAAKQAIDRALALQPDLGDALFARALYWYWGFRDYARAQDALALARKALPHDFLVEEIGAAIARRQGRWQQALDGLRQAQAYDPRNASPAFETGQTLAVLRRYAESDRAYARAAELTQNPSLSLGIQAWNTVLWKGDIAPLRAALASLPPTSEEYRSTRLAAFAVAWLSRDFAAAAKVVQESNAVLWNSTNGNTLLPRRLYLAWAVTASGDSAMAEGLYRGLHAQALIDVRERPNDWDRHLALGFAAAGLGLKDEALREAHRATELLPVGRDAFAGPEVLGYAARIDEYAGDHDAAIAKLQRLMAMPAGLWVSPAMLRIDPAWDPLRKDPRFQKLIADGDAASATNH
ncbi:MAG: tetratricopeptide repeat protein [Rudaea sp.]